MSWVKAFDQSFNPATNLKTAYDAGFRVMGGYAGGGTSNKWMTKAQISAWHALGSDTGIAPLFEIVGNEPITDPTSGARHARAARAAWRALGVPDHVSIGAAVDLNVSMSQAQHQLATYFSAWKANDTVPAIAYVEYDAGHWLFQDKLIAGIFTPAAYLWDSSGKLFTPANAPADVVWTQEHNGEREAGGLLDIGHIRTTAPIWWSDEMNQADFDKIQSMIDSAVSNLKQTMPALVGNFDPNVVGGTTGGIKNPPWNHDAPEQGGTNTTVRPVWSAEIQTAILKALADKAGIDVTKLVV